MDKIFNDLKGIGKGKDIRNSDQPLERMIKITGELLKESDYDKIYPSLVSETKNLEFDLYDIKNLVLSCANGQYEMPKRRMLGFIMGQFYKLYKKKDFSDNLRLEIDGKGARFDYLFNTAYEIDDLILRNFTGDYFCSCYGSNKGRNKTLALVNIKGKSLTEGFGMDFGRIENLILIGNETDELMTYYHGEIDLLIAMNNKIETFGYPLNSNNYLRINNLVVIDNQVNNRSVPSFAEEYKATDSLMRILTYAKTRHTIIENNKDPIDYLSDDLFPFNQLPLTCGLDTSSQVIEKHITFLARSIKQDDTDQMMLKVEEIRKEFSKPWPRI